MPVDTDQSMPVVPTIAEAVEEPQDLEGAHIGDDQNEPDEAGASDAENGHDEAHDDQKDQRWKPPTIEAAHTAHSRIKAILRPQRDNGVGHKDPGLDLLLKSVEVVLKLCNASSGDTLTSIQSSTISGWQPHWTRHAHPNMVFGLQDGFGSGVPHLLRTGITFQ